MNTPSFFRRFARVARTHPWAVRGLLLGLVAWVVTCFALGYRLPWFDRHPDWGYFPTLTNPRLVVEEIPDSVFAPRYGHRFHLLSNNEEEEFYSRSSSLKNLYSLGYQVTENAFHLDWEFDLYFGGNPAGTGIERDNLWEPGFRNKGYEYMEVRLGQERGYFKGRATSNFPALGYFHQYNYPMNQQDTLYLRCWNTNYGLHVR